MDMKACVKELPQELARELLIAISNSVPEKHPSPDNHLPQKFDNANGVAVTNGDEAEKYRSDLISLSYFLMIAIHSIAESEALPFFSWKIYPANASSVYQALAVTIRCCIGFLESGQSRCTEILECGQSGSTEKSGRSLLACVVNMVLQKKSFRSELVCYS
ncbi:hypothetical protein CUMW_250910 [Citrus unshiu]|uniref:Uncharacterized protein n=1 Tax=Citrus unshiu TaxID=55188 RepID=A0A2H5QQ11_CITUN|nr:hypothetical protein CUMW_250910 [Citrus unshiu]